MPLQDFSAENFGIRYEQKQFLPFKRYCFGKPGNFFNLKRHVLIFKH